MEDKKLSWADVPPNQVGPIEPEETSQEETVAEIIAADKEKDDLSDGSESDMKLDDEGQYISFTLP